MGEHHQGCCHLLLDFPKKPLHQRWMERPGKNIKLRTKSVITKWNSLQGEKFDGTFGIPLYQHVSYLDTK